MRRLPSFRYHSGDGHSDAASLAEDFRESFTKTFAYDLFDWIVTPGKSSVVFRPAVTDGRTPRPDSPDGDPVSLYTSNADIPIYTLGEVVPFEGAAGVFPQTNTSGPLVGIDDFRVDARFAGIDGSGYTIAVLDTGIDLDDPFFGPDTNGDGISDRIVFHYDFADNDADGSDFHNHGSNVASIAASSDSTYTGMAPGANIAALKVFSNAGTGNFGDIEEALQWVVANAAAYNIVSVNMSLSDLGNYSAPVQLYGIADELATLAAMDVVVVSASGNDFYSFNSVQGVAYPSADPNSLSVGAVYEGSYSGWSYGSGAVAFSTVADQITPFSQRDDQLSDIFAPGAPITGAGASASLVTMHGTSQAAPHIAGVIALAQELAVQELGRKLTYDEIDQLLKSSGDTIIDGDDEDDNVNNTGLAFQRLNVLALGEAILAMAAVDPPRGDTFFEVSSLDIALPEGNSGTTGFTFEITRSGDLTAADSVDYSVAGSGAAPASGDDFSGGSFPAGSVTFEIGETSKIVVVEVAGDGVVESDEGFALTIDSVPSNGQIVVASAGATIENDDQAAPGPVPVVLVQADFDLSGDTGGFVYLDGLFGGSMSQNYADGSWADQTLAVNLGGINNTDVTNMSGGWQTSFTLGTESEVSLSFVYNLTIDSDYEPDEYTQVLVSIDGGPPVLVHQLTGDGNGGLDQPTGSQTFNAILGTLAAGSHTLEIGAFNNKKTYFNETSQLTIDDVLLTGTPTSVAPPAATFFEIAALDAAKAEGDAGTTAFTFTVTRTGDTAAAGSVDYAVSGLDVDGLDFIGGTLPAGTVSFLAGEASQTLTIEVAGDTDFEGDEGFTVTLSNPSAGSAITTATAGGTILNDDAAPPATFFEIAALDAAKAEGDVGTTAFSFTVTRTGDTAAAGSVDYAVSGLDVDGLDFNGGTLPAGTVSFLAGEVSRTLTVEVAGDTDFEGDEGFTVTLSNPSSGSALTTATAGGTILNDDAAPPAGPLVVIDESFDSGSGGFVYEDGAFGGANPQSYADGAWIGGVLTIDLGGIDNADIFDMSGSWTTSFNLVAESDVSLSFLYELIIAPGYEPNEFSQVLVSLDDGPAILVDSLTGDGNGGPVQSTGQQSSNVALGLLAAGSHTLTIGGFNNQKTTAGEVTNITLDDVLLTAMPTIPADTLFSIAALDPALAEGDAGTAVFNFSIIRSGDISRAGSVDYSVVGSGVDAAEFDDFVGGLLPSGSIDFLAGEASKTIVIVVSGDTVFEGDEAFSVVLANASAGHGIGSGSADSVILNDDPLPAGPLVLIDENFDASGDTGGFSYADGRFGGPNPQTYAEGSWASGALTINLGGIDSINITNMSGAWEIDFELAAAMDATLSFDYELVLAADYESNEFSQVLVSLDGGAPILVAELFGDGNGGFDQTTGLQSLELDLGNLAAGSHSLAIGGYNNRKTVANEATEITIDDVLLTGTAPGPAGLADAGSPPGVTSPGMSEQELIGLAGI